MTESAAGGSRLNRVRVTIDGSEYTLRTDEPVKHVEKLAARLDRDLRELTERFPIVPKERLAVLLALKLASQLDRAREQVRAARRASLAEPTPSPEPVGTDEPADQSDTAEANTAATSLFDSSQGDTTA